MIWMKNNIDEWRGGPDILTLLDPVSRKRIQKQQQTLAQIKAMPSDDMEALSALMELTGHRDYVKRFRDIPRQIFSFAPEKTYGKYVKLTFLFYIIHSPGLSMIHREALGDIHRTLITVIGKRGDYKKDMVIVDQTFALLKEHKGRYPETVLECIHKIGDAVYNTDEIELINHFIDRSVDHGFQFPDISGTGEDWQIKCNVAHVKNIRVFSNPGGQAPEKVQTPAVRVDQLTGRGRRIYPGHGPVSPGHYPHSSTRISHRYIIWSNNWPGCCPPFSMRSVQKESFGIFPPAWMNWSSAGTG